MSRLLSVACFFKLGDEGHWVERFFLDFRCLKCFVIDGGEPVVIGILKGVLSHPGWLLKEVQSTA